MNSATPLLKGGSVPFIKQISLLERFEQKYIPEPNSGCWLWTAGVNRLGYGTIGTGSRSDGSMKKSFAHRVSYALYRREIPDGLTIDHLCRVRCCVNPDHLDTVSQGVNNLRGRSASSLNSAKTHCPRGHEFNEASVQSFTGKTGQRLSHRICRECNRTYQRLWAAKKRNASNGG